MSIFGRGLILYLTLVVPALVAQALPSHSAQGKSSEALQPEAAQLLALANRSRAEQGVAPLKWDAALARAARQHCLRMAAEGPIAHRYAGEPDVSERAGQAGAHFSLIEENVAVGPNPATIHDEWMHSPGHRANLLNPEVDRLGVAVVASRGTLYAVADYERDVPILTRNQVETKIVNMVQAKGVTVLRDADAARAACATSKGVPISKSGPRVRFIMRWQDADLTQLPGALEYKLGTGQFHSAAVGSCQPQGQQGSFTAYRIAVLLY
jgi:hypothetical protein